MNRWMKDCYRDRYLDCKTSNKFSGRWNLSLNELAELDELVEKCIPLIVEEFLSTQEGWDTFITCTRKNREHAKKTEELGYPDTIELEDYRKDTELKQFLDGVITDYAEKLAKWRIRSA